MVETAEPVSLAYTYAGEESEVSNLKEAANYLARLGKTSFAQALYGLAEDLEMGIAMGVLAPGDTVYYAM
jgi:hypothetical protein